MDSQDIVHGRHDTVDDILCWECEYMMCVDPRERTYNVSGESDGVEMEEGRGMGVGIEETGSMETGGHGWRRESGGKGTREGGIIYKRRQEETTQKA